LHVGRPLARTDVEERLEFADALRGVAVLLMVLWHTVDAWLADAARAVGGHDTATFTVLRCLGGGAAPLFTLLAGASMALKTSADARRGVSPRASAISGAARGAELIVVGYLLRVQFFAIDAGGFREPGALVPLVAGLGLAWLATRSVAATGAATMSVGARRRAIAQVACLALTGAALYAVGLGALATLRPDRLPGLLRVDILQSIGASLVLLTLLEPLLRRAPALAVVLATWVAVLSHSVGAVLPGRLPAALAAYVGRWPVDPGERSLAMFPLLPWLAFPLLGYAIGRFWEAAARRGTVWRDVTFVGGALGLTLAVAANETRMWRAAPSLLHTEPWLLPLLRVVARTGMALALASVCAVLVRLGPARLATALRTLGRASLFVYWIHLPLTFGTLAAPLKRRLDVGTWLAGFVALTALVYVLVRLKEGPGARLLSRTRGALLTRARRPLGEGT
jgi:uncharacterized membrane protein